MLKRKPLLKSLLIGGRLQRFYILTVKMGSFGNVTELVDKSEAEIIQAISRLEINEVGNVFSGITAAIERAVCTGDSDGVEKYITLRDHAAKCKGSIPCDFVNNTRLIVLAGTHNQSGILKLLFNCRITEKGKSEAFYYVIRSNNPHLLEELLEKTTSEDLHYLADALEQLKVKNVLLSEEMEVMATNKLGEYMFWGVQTADNYFERIEVMMELTDTLIQEYRGAEDVDWRFIYLCRILAQQIYILRKQLNWGTSWLHLELMLTTIVLSYTKICDINLYFRYIVDKEKILQYLVVFSAIPAAERSEGLGEPAAMKQLETDYWRISDTMCLERLKVYSETVVSAEYEEEEGKGAILRAVQQIAR